MCSLCGTSTLLSLGEIKLKTAKTKQSAPLFSHDAKCVRHGLDIDHKSVFGHAL